MHIILIDGAERDNLLPFTFTRPVSEIRFGILTITQKWEKHLQSQAGFITQEYLKYKFPNIK
jgi:hypothetical protein